MKKLLAISMALVLVLALCACSSGSSSESKAKGFVGSWEMESYTSTASQDADHTIEVKMEILDDKSFSYTENETDSKGNSLKSVVSGTYTESDKKADFNYTHITTSVSGATSESDEQGTFTGTLDGDKLKIVIDRDGDTTTINFKRA